jgi:hypothetical protein
MLLCELTVIYITILAFYPHTVLINQYIRILQKNVFSIW